VFDKAARPGGMLMNGLPGFRLEKDVVEAEIDILKEMGVEFRCGVEVGKDVTIPELRAQGYKGFYLAIGLQNGGKLNVPGDDAEGVIAGIDFIKRVNMGEDVKLNGKVVVIGGGSIGADVARTAARCGAESVTLYCLESYNEMPMGEEDQNECKHDGIIIRDGWGQTEVLTENGKCKGIKFRKCLSVKDASGKFAPTFDDETTETAECTTVLYCIGLKTDWGKLLEGTKVELSPRGFALADGLTYQTAEPDIFVGGDAYYGQKFVIDAIAAGKEAAISLHRAVHPGQTLTFGRDRRNYRALDKENILVDPNSYDHGSRQIPGYNAAKEKTFGSTRVTFTEEQVRKETARCLKCGATKVDPYLCVGCGLCTTKCMFDAIHLEKTREWHADEFETMPIKVAEHLVKRTGKIIGNAVTRK
jgi:NADPH-dependent glutamate synthase beta subunit-like oxidoreductase